MRLKVLNQYLLLTIFLGFLIKAERNKILNTKRKQQDLKKCNLLISCFLDSSSSSNGFCHISNVQIMQTFFYFVLFDVLARQKHWQLVALLSFDSLEIWKRTEKEDERPLSILIEVILIQPSFFESKATVPPAVVWARLVMQALTCTGRWAGQHQWPCSPPACQHLPAAGNEQPVQPEQAFLSGRVRSEQRHRRLGCHTALLFIWPESLGRLTIASAQTDGNEPCSV